MSKQNIESVFPLSPMQQGMMFHSLNDPGSGVYIEQFRYDIEGLDVTRFRDSWTCMFERFAALRTSLAGVGKQEPAQVVRREVELPWREEDLRHLGAEEQQEWITSFLCQDAVDGFDFRGASLARLTLLRLGEARYEFIWTFHHIILDGWSGAIVEGELFKCYEALRRGAPPDRTTPRPFGDYIAWLRRQDLSRAEAYWRRTLGGFDSPTTLASGSPRRETRRYADRIVHLPESTTRSLRRQAGAQGVTLNTLVLGAWALVLGRYCGAEDVLFGSVVSGRPEALGDAQSMVGMFINTLPCRVRVPPSAKVGSWLQDLQRDLLEQRDYEFTPVWQVQQWSDLPAGTPLFDSLYVFENYPRAENAALGAGGIRIRRKPSLERVGYPLMLMVGPGDRLGLRLVRDADRYSESTAELVLNHLGAALERLAEPVERRLGQVSLLGADERRRVVESWNRTARPYPSDRRVHELFEAQARRVPDRPAVVFGDDVLTYRELDERANRLAHHLGALGIGPGDLAGLCLERSHEMLVAVLAILKTGAAYVPLDPGFPSERVAYMLRDAGVAVVVCSDRARAAVPAIDAFVAERPVPLVCVDRDASRILQRPTTAPSTHGAADSRAYVIYTSGSTGQPKGVEITHRSVVNFLASMAERPGMGENDVLLAVTTLSFDIAALELLLPLYVGARVVIASGEDASDGLELQRKLGRCGATVMQATPATWQMLLHAGWSGDPKLKVLCGGEALPRPVADALLVRSAELWNMYGPTETTIWSAVSRVEAEPAPISLGAPIANTRLYVLDGSLEPVPVGMPGELYIAGDGLALGYLGRPALTAEKFVPDPFGDAGGTRLYRTGDLVRYEPTGELHFLGRTDHQVKLRGFRIELGEIESTLSDHPWVREAAVVIREDFAGDRRLTAYVVPDRVHDEADMSALLPQWESVWDDAYRQPAGHADPTFNISGWNSSYTGEPIPPDEMRAWLEDTVGRILSRDPGRVLEIGCGTGLVLFRVAPRSSRYTGTDFSGVALDYIRQHLGEVDDLSSRVLLSRRSAHDFEGIEPRSFDTVILNSVIQYFPSVEYLVRVLEGAVEAVAPGGRVFLGDVRNLRLLSAFHASVLLHQSPGDVKVAEFARQLERTVMQEQELAVDPELFFALQSRIPRIRHVAIELKPGRPTNELTKFRYDVTLHVEGAGMPAPAPAPAVLEWGERPLTRDRIRDLLREYPNRPLVVARVPNARTLSDSLVVDILEREQPPDTVAELREQLARVLGDRAVAPSDWFELRAEAPFEVRLSWSRASERGEFDAWFVPRELASSIRESEPAVEPRPWQTYTNHPVRAKRSRQLAPTLRQWVDNRLPEYMVPSAFVTVEALPLTANGKINRRALLSVGYAPLESREPHVAPRNPEEELLCEIWTDLLGVSNPGVNDDFFQLGGHSLTATQLVARIRDTLGVELPVRAVFDNPTVAGIAGLVRRDTTRVAEAAPIQRIERDGELPLSFAQQRLWFLDQLGTGAAYNLPWAFRLKGDLDIEALESSVHHVVRRHEVLRTRFPSSGGRPYQEILPALRVPLQLADLSGIDPERRELEARRLHAAEAAAEFDLATGPLLRTNLMRLGAREHVLIFNVHHIVFDGWSIGVLGRELAALYAGYTSGAAPELPALPVQYADFAAWQNRWLRGDELEKQLGFWRAQLAGAVPLELPTDRPRPTEQTFDAGMKSLDLSAELGQQLNVLARRVGVTPSMILMAAFSVVLSRHCGQRDVVIGTPIANRNRVEIEDLIGFFVNTLALRIDCGGDPEFLELVDAVRRRSLAAYEHQDLPFEKLVEDLQPERHLARNPIVQVLFVMHNTAQERFGLPGLQVEPFAFDSHATPFDLELHLRAEPSTLKGALRFNSTLFDPATIDRLAGHYHTLLRGIVARPKSRLSELPLLGDEERNRVLVAWNATDRDHPHDRLIHQFFEQQVERTPEATAIVFADQQLTYAELDARANQLANKLVRSGVGPDVTVAVCLARSPDVIVALLGVLKAGGAYVPLDPTYPRDRLTYMLGACGAPVLLTHQELLAELPGFDGTVVCLDRDWPAVSSEPATSPRPATTPDHLAYVIYTSGSTGRPKGVALHHAPLVNLLCWQMQVSPPRAHERTIQFGTLSFDQHYLDIFATLAVGGTLLLIPEELRRDMVALLQFMDDRRVTRIWTPYVALRQMAEVADEIGITPRDLRLVVVAGEQLQITRQVADFFRRLPDCVLCNEYGPAETHVVTALDLEGPPEEWPALPSIGTPIANSKVYVLDEHLRPVPIGVPGEIYLGGATVGRGYLDAPELTAERFIPDPYGDEGARLYKTGDMGRHRADGEIQFLGRGDHQVKIRGYRIEPGEIEVTATGHPDVKHAVAVPRESRAGHRQIVLYVVPEEGRSISRAELHGFFKDRLPEYMVPANVVVLGSLPLSPAGKVDRAALPEPAEGTAAGEIVAPRNLTEELLAGVWSDVLELAAPGVHDNFFELGGHSLLATQVVSRVRRLFDVELPVRALFENQTIAALAARIEGMRGEGRGPQTLSRVPRAGELPVSLGQRRLWLLDRLGAGTAYNLPMHLRLRGALDRGALERSFTELVRRHETLRTTFAIRDGEPIQVVADPAPVVIPLDDLRDRPPGKRETEAIRVAGEFTERRFDLTSDVPFRVRLIRLDQDDHVLLLTIHHIVADGWSQNVLRSELAALYEAYVGNGPSPLAELEIQYADYSVWQRRSLQGAVLERQLAYWRGQLSGVAALELPTDHPRPPIQTYSGGVERIDVPHELRVAVKELGARTGTTLFMTLIGAFQVLLHRYSGQDDIAVGTAVANRSMVELEKLIGFFINTLVLRTDLSGDPSFSELLVRIREAALGAYQHQDVPFEMLVDELAPEREPSRNPLYQVAFALQNTPRDVLSLPGLTLGGFMGDSIKTRHEIELHAWEDGAGLHFGFIYNTDLYEATTIQRMAGHYRALLESIAAQPDAPLSELRMLPETEREALARWNDVSASFPVEERLHEGFERQVARTPDAVALVSGGESLSYRELNARANRLAHLLRDRGVGREVLVGLAVERGIEIVVGILGILKAGGAYVPLDLANPTERLAFILEDTALRVLVTTRDCLGRLPTHDAEAICLDQDRDVLIDRPSGNPEVAGGAGDLAYVIYTSGSTGRPKGVLIEHRMVGRLFRATEEWFGFDHNDVWTLFHSFAFDFSVWELWGALLYGGRLVVVPYMVSRSPEEFRALLAREGVTVLNQTPSAFRQLIRADEQAGSDLALRLVIFGGEALELQSLRPWFDRHGDRRPQLVNMYGITETTVHVTYRPLGVADLDEAPGSMIGRPIPDLQVHILDGHRQPVPIGVPGEIYVGGAGVARGYLRRDELTAERFVADPFREEPDARLYRTGDVGRFGANGDIEYLGRNDDQVKIRGHRIELGEIESVLAQHPAVREVVAHVRDYGGGDRRLAAYVVPHEACASPVLQLERMRSDGRLDGHQTFDLPNGMTVFHLNRNETEFLYEEIFDQAQYSHHGIVVRDGDCVFDVGANIGLFSLAVGARLPNVKLYAFEPLPPVCEIMKLNAEVYGLDLVAFECGLAAERGNAEFVYYPNVSIFSGRYADEAAERQVVKSFVKGQQTAGDAAPVSEALLDELLTDRLESRTVTCALRTVSDVMREHGVQRIDLLKVDVEKSELDVLAGIEPEDWPRIQQLVVEVHDVHGSLETVERILSGHGYVLAVEQEASLEQTNLHVVYARRPTAVTASEPQAPKVADSPMRWSSPARLTEELKSWSEARLPAYMVPWAIGLLDRFPLTANGKIDRRALPEPDELVRREAVVAPRTAVEHKLVEIWQHVLKQDRIGIDQGFFSLGGDSILAIQVVAMANEAGLHLSTRQMFQHQTIAELAAVVGTGSVLEAEQGAVTGDVPLTPIQKWFFEQEQPEPAHFNQTVLVSLRAGVSTESCREAVRHLLEHHDALRLRFTREASGWKQCNAAVDGAVPFEILDLSGIPERDRAMAITREATRLQASLDLTAGPLFRAALIELGPDVPGRLLFVAHHAVIDGVSWRILLADFQQAYRRLERGESIHPPRKTMSFRHWSQQLLGFADSPGIVAQADAWMRAAPVEASVIPVDHPGGSDTEDTTAQLHHALTIERTRQVLQQVPRVYNTEINDVLLTALVMAMGRWTGRSNLFVDLEGHGREELFGGEDVSRTVGWFTTMYPVALEIEDPDDPGKALKSVKEQLRAVPGRGLGYGLLRYLRPGDSTAERLAALPRPQIVFNYLGQLDVAVDDKSMFALAPESSGPVSSPRNRRTHLLELGGVVVGGRLRLTLGYSTAVHERSTVQDLLRHFSESLEAVIDHCLVPGVGGFTPSDFPLARIEQAVLDRLQLKFDRDPIEDIYALSPMQQGVVFHSLLDRSPGVYVLQVRQELRGFDRDTYIEAWQHVIDRHQALRMSIVGGGTGDPVQVIRRRVTVPVEERDCPGMAEAETEAWVDRFMKEDLARGIPFDDAIPMRLTILDFGTGRLDCVWTVHHVALDGWSFAIVLAEVIRCYDALRRGEAPDLGPRPRYRDYIAWLGRQDLAAAEAYWRKCLAGLPAPTPLATEDRLGDDSREYGEFRFRLSRDTTRRLRSVAAQHGLTPNTIAVGAWAILHGRYCGTRDVLFGTTVSGRPPEVHDAESMVGVFINTLPLRVQVPEDVPAARWFGELQVRQSEQREFEYTPLWRIRQWSDLPAGAPLFDSIVVFENQPFDEEAVQKWTHQDRNVRWWMGTERVGYPLMTMIVPGEEMLVRMTYQCSRFAPESIESLAEHYRAILERFVADPTSSAEELSRPTQAESRRILVEWNDTAQSYPREKRVHELIAEACRLSPDAPAIVRGRQSLTYAELDARSSRVAHALETCGVRRGTIVGLCVDRSVEMVAGLLGVHKAGAAYVPIDPALPGERIRFMLEDAGVVACVTTSETLEQVPDLARHSAARGVPLVRLDAEPALGDRPTSGFSGGGTAEDLAYVIFTSGSTGKPKGVEVTHRNVVNFLESMRREPGFGPRDVLLAVTTLSFDIAVLELLLPLIAGGTVVIAPAEATSDGKALQRLLHEHAVTVMQATPATWQLLIHSGWTDPSRRLRMLCGGEALPRPLADALLERGADLSNMYGPTETTVWSSVARVEREGAAGSAPITIGQPIANTQLYVLDRVGRPVPRGAIGELFIGGDGVTRGYLNRPELTAERFVPDPFHPLPGARMYRTGDLVRHDSRDRLRFLGRIDHQVKLRGFRIELGEIESVLLEHPAVREVTVVAHDFDAGDRRLVAYVAGDAGVAERDLIAFAADRLPRYMVPSLFLTLPELPRLTSGKVNRSALPAPERTRAMLEPDFVAPRNDTEEKLCRIWAEVLSVDRVGIHDDFFELGGHSLLALRVTERIRDMFGVAFELHDVLVRRTIAEASEKIEVLRWSRSARESRDAVASLDREEGLL